MTDVLDPAEVVSVRRSKMPVILAGAVAVALVLSIGAYVGYRFLFGGTQPAERMPGSVIAYVSVDLTPSLGQSKNLRDLARKFPESSQDTDPKTTVHRLLERAAPGDVDMKRDVTTWLGLRAAAGVWLDNAGKPYLVIAAQSTDDKAAAAGLTSIRDSAKGRLGYVVRDGYVVIAIGEQNGQAAADAATAEAEKSPLAKAAKYTDARAWLQDEQFAVFFLDFDALGKVQREAIAKEMGDAFKDPGDPEEIGSFDLGSPMPTGTVVGGVRAEADGVVARFRVSGAKSGNGTVPDAVGKLGAMPAATSVGIVSRVPDDLQKSPFAMWSMLVFSPLMLWGMEEETEVPGQEPMGNLTPAEQAEFEELMTKRIAGTLTAKEQKRLDELMAKLSTFTPRELTPAEQKELDALMAKGEDLTEAEQKRISELLGFPTGPFPGEKPGDAWDHLFTLISGGIVTATLTDVLEKPAFRAVFELTSAPAKESAEKVKGLAGKDVAVLVDGQTITVNSTVTVTEGGRLADDPLFGRAIAGAPTTDVQTAFYLNLSKAMPDRRLDKPGPVKAVCLVQSIAGGDQVSQLRILIG